ncbi:hypothetical protein [Streptomyces sp. NPDC002851]
MLALLDSLERFTPTERHPAVAAQRALLTDAVTETPLPHARREFALQPDRQGIS